MPIPKVKQFDSDRQHVYLKYYLRGEQYSSSMSHTRSDSAKREWILNQYYWEQKTIHEEPALIISRRFKTHYFVYEVHVESRNPDNELEFLELESQSFIHYKEIWRCFYKPEHISKLDLNPPVEDIIEPVGNFFAFPYKDLEGLITNNIILGWRREEIITSIHKLLNLDLNTLFDFEREKVKHLRELVNQNPEILNHSQAA